MSADFLRCFQVLNVSPGASFFEIRKAFLELSKKYHPDRNPDPCAAKSFRRLKKAYHTLLAYMDPVHSVHRGSEKVVQCTLQEAYAGAVKRLAVVKTQACSQRRACPSCDGEGMKKKQSEALALVQPCAECRGTGFVCSESCSECRGQGQVTSQELKEVYLYPGVETGDYVEEYVVKVLPHPTFQRWGCDLYTVVHIPLVFALTGCSYYPIEHLNRQIAVSWSGVLKPGTVKKLEGHGMPTKTGAFGDLYIRFEVEFPESIPASDVLKIRKLFPVPVRKGDLPVLPLQDS